MGLKYICENCGKTFSPGEYARLGIMVTYSDMGKLVGRKCDICGKQIKVWRF